LIASLAIGLLCVVLGACGDTSKSGTTSSASSKLASANQTTTYAWPKPTHLPSIATTRRYLNDPGLPVEVVREDSRILAFDGRAPSAAVSRSVTAAAKRYYALAVADDGKTACSMVTPGFAMALPVDYGQFGPSYLRGARTCQAVLTRIFKHSHDELTAPIKINGVLAKGNHAYAVLDSRKMPASILPLVEEHGTWMVYAPLAGRIPIAK
jgi:hypothetical protein